MSEHRKGGEDRPNSAITDVEGDMDRYLTNKASAFRYPSTPDIASSVRNRLLTESYGGQTRSLPTRHPRRAWGALFLSAAAVVLLLLFVPGVRLLVEDVYTGVVRAVQGEDRNPPVPDVPVPGPLAWNPRLMGETDLASAQQYSITSIKLPTYTAGLGLPVYVYHQPFEYEADDMLIYVWLDMARPEKPAMTLIQLPPTVNLLKKLDSSGVGRQYVAVGAYKGAWLDEPYPLQVTSYNEFGSKVTGPQEVLEGNTLIWYDEQNFHSYKLTGTMTRDEAIKVAASMSVPTALPAPRPTSTPASPSSLLDLVGETYVYFLSQSIDFSYKVPVVTDMPELVQPDKVYVQHRDGSTPQSGSAVIFVWYSPDRPDNIRMVLTQGTWDVSPTPSLDGSSITTAVKNSRATWGRGTQQVYVQGRDGPVLEERALIADSHALTWQKEGIYYRLETTLPMSKAVEIAEALR